MQNKTYNIIFLFLLFLISCSPIRTGDIINDEQTQELRQIGQQKYEQESYNDAIIIFKEIYNTTSNNNEKYYAGYMVGLSYYKLGDLAQAENEIDNLLNNDLREDIKMSALRLKTDIQIEDGAIFESITTLLIMYENIENSDPYKEDIQKLILQQLSNLSSDEILLSYQNNKRSSFAAGLLYTGISTLVKEGKIELAENYWDELLTQYPSSPYAFMEFPYKRTFVPNLIGVILPLDGSYSQYSNQVLNGIKLALKNTEFEYKVYNLSNNTLEELLQKMIYDDGVSIIIGPLLSSTSLIAAEICNVSGVTMVTPTATDEGISEVGSYIFQINREDEESGIALVAHYAIENGNYSTYAIIYEEDYKTQADIFTENITSLGGRIIGKWEFPKGTSDYSLIASQVLDSQPEAIFISARYQEIVQLTPTLRFVGCQAQFFGDSSWDYDQIIRYGEDAVVNAIFIGKGIAGNEVLNFLTDYSREYREEPSRVSRLGFDAANIVMMAYSSLDNVTNSKEIGEAILNIKIYRGTSGGIILSRGASFEYNLLTIQRGRIIPVE